MKYKKTLKYVALICCAMMIGGTYTNAKVYLMKDNKIVGAYYDSEVDRLTFEMPKDAEVEFRAQNFRGTYYGDKKSPGIANYNFFLSDVGLGRGGWMLPYGQYYRINLFGDVADQNEPLRVPDGEYVFAENTKDEEGNDTPVRDKGTFSDYSSRYFETIDGGKTEVNQRFTEGILKVFSKSGGVQVFDLEVTTEDGVKHHVVYEGVTSSFDDESGKLDYIPMDILSEDVTDLVLTRSDAMYYGTDNGVSSLWLQFFDMDVDRNGFPVPPGNKLDLVVTSPEIRGNHLPAGKYRISADGTVYTIEPGSKKVEFALEVANGSYISVASSATDWKYGIFDGGEMTVTEDEDGTHHISFDFKMGDYKTTGRFDGKLEIKGAPREGTLSTLTEDHEIPFQSGDFEAYCILYGDFYGRGANNWVLNLMPAEDNPHKEVLSVEINTVAGDFAEGIPSGAYSASKTGEAWTVMPGYEIDGVLYGTLWMKMNEQGYVEEVAPATECDFSVYKALDGTYTFDIWATDDSAERHHFYGYWSGPVNFRNEASQAAPAKKAGMKLVK